MAQVPENVRSIGRSSRIFYFFFQTLGILLLIVLQSDLRIFAAIRMLFEMLIANYFYLACTDSAGESLRDDTELGRMSSSSMVVSPNEESKESVKTISDELPERNFCSECQLLQQFRTKHCSQCKKCIPKYDHHCFWIGGCVGELNHRLFYIFLGFQSLFCTEAFFQFFDQLDYYSIIDEKTGKDQYQLWYWIIFMMCALSFCFALFTGILFAYHSMLISIGKTTWEQTKRQQITYLKFYDDIHYHPFDYGFIQNLKLTFCHNNQLQQWSPPPKSEMKEQFNCFDNKYYSCC